MEVTLGFMPFVDSAALIIASEKGFAADEGLRLRLVRETSWANIRDRVAVGQFDGAPMPAPLPLAANLGLYPVSPALLVAMTLNLAGGAVTVSQALFDMLKHAQPNLDPSSLDPIAAGQALKAVVRYRQASLKPLRFAIGFDHSSQGYQLRYWLNACGLVVGRDVDLVALPSPLMADALSEGAIDGFCAAEPWNSLAVSKGVGRILTTSAEIWRNGPDKVLGLSKKWAQDNDLALDALLRALHRSAQWCGNRDNIEELAGILAAPRHLGVEGHLMLPALTGEVTIAPGLSQKREGFLVLERKTGGFPRQSQALWFYSQMVRAGHVVHSAENRNTVVQTYRPDLYRRALKPIFAPMPATDDMRQAMALSGSDGFFDGAIFDPDRLENHLSP
ncbi:CmpA/NrtA family ABC transporter substrate-binding protein [Rhizobium oryziradicis]|uniref:Nitrate transporter n=1 Tax=Rhizobium oryziradicis TaxID=1867956 RepID=A0A1Q8ZUJ1_9HYPH|nr:CmpA/NrtA family ABC transporter substrate-binding protein [Rhizobium oryziradicis]OLP45695.1 nitrate transporter [Rhizobium oryziradicis]